LKHIKRHILTIVLISIILALILNIKENKNIADDILFLKSIQKNEEEKNQKKQNKIRENQEKNMEYKFNVSWKNTNYNQVNLTDTIKKQTLINKKIAPGLEGRFNIILTTNKDSKYYIKFENKAFLILSDNFLSNLYLRFLLFLYFLQSALHHLLYLEHYNPHPFEIDLL